MSSPLLSLDQLQLYSTQFEHELRVVSSVQISSINNIVSTREDPKLLDALICKEIWATRGVGLQLAIKVFIDGKHLADPEQRTFLIEGLGVALQKAELWKQLRLRTSLSLPSLQAGLHSTTPDIVIQLHHAEGPGKVEPVPKRRAAYSSTYIEDVLPPFGVPSVGLESINLTLHFYPSESRNVGSKNKKAKAVKVNRLQEVFPLTKDEENDDILLSDDECFSQPILPTGRTQRFDFNEPDHERKWSSQPTGSLGFVSLLDDSVEDFKPLLLDKPYPSQDPPLQNDISNSPTLKRRAEDKATDPTPPPLQLQEAIQLTDAALRNLICNKPLQIAPGIKVNIEKESPNTKLADLAPALWSPGYLPAIAQRSHLIPTTAQTMASLSTQARSSRLRDKLSAIGNLAFSPIIKIPNTETTTSQSSTVTSQAISKVLKARLWRMMQQSLYDPKAARRLHPLQVIKTLSTQASEIKLDEFLSTPSNILSTPIEKDEDEFEEMLFNRLETAEEMLFDKEYYRSIFLSTSNQEEEFVSLFDDEDISMNGYDEFEQDWWLDVHSSMPDANREGMNTNEDIDLFELEDFSRLSSQQREQALSANRARLYNEGEGLDVDDDEILLFSDEEDDILLLEQEELLERAQ
ncbi:MAG: hypothetical protein M1812_006799 [Candelaria pacifica]|nr:MAG: hypothetical protein M1812_006799 [Candelaria pacifica]